MSAVFRGTRFTGTTIIIIDDYYNITIRLADINITREPQ